MEKKYALKLGEDGRILYATYPEFAPQDAVVVDTLPEGDLHDYCYVDGEFIHNPIPEEEVEEETSLEDRVGELEEALNLILTGVTE